jgi:hypothetical protein
MSTAYETDVVAWADEQAALLRAGRFAELDIEHIADEVEDVGKSEQRELSSRMAVLLSHLLEWRMQPERREMSGRSWRGTIKLQREDVIDHLEDVPSLQRNLSDPRWIARVWRSAKRQTIAETSFADDDLPEVCPWSMEEALDPNFLPD